LTTLHRSPERLNYLWNHGLIEPGRRNSPITWSVATTARTQGSFTGTWLGTPTPLLSFGVPVIFNAS
ncbi:MAG: hypothetical protein ACYCVV_04870, partial [Acidimicrobiales bacterium]